MSSSFAVGQAPGFANARTPSRSLSRSSLPAPARSRSPSSDVDSEVEAFCHSTSRSPPDAGRTELSSSRSASRSPPTRRPESSSSRSASRSPPARRTESSSSCSASRSPLARHTDSVHVSSFSRSSSQSPPADAPFREPNGGRDYPSSTTSSSASRAECPGRSHADLLELDVDDDPLVRRIQLWLIELFRSGAAAKIMGIDLDKGEEQLDVASCKAMMPHPKPIIPSKAFNYEDDDPEALNTTKVDSKFVSARHEEFLARINYYFKSMILGNPKQIKWGQIHKTNKDWVTYQIQKDGFHVSHETIKRYLRHTHANRRRDYKKRKRNETSGTGMEMSGRHLPSRSAASTCTQNGAEDVDVESKYSEPALIINKPVKIRVVTDGNASTTIGYAAQLVAIGPVSYQGIVVKDGYVVVSNIQEKSGHGVPETHQPKVGVRSDSSSWTSLSFSAACKRSQAKGPVVVRSRHVVARTNTLTKFSVSQKKKKEREEIIDVEANEVDERIAASSAESHKNASRHRPSQPAFSGNEHPGWFLSAYTAWAGSNGYTSEKDLCANVSNCFSDNAADWFNTLNNYHQTHWEDLSKAIKRQYFVNCTKEWYQDDGMPVYAYNLDASRARVADPATIRTPIRSSISNQKKSSRTKPKGLTFEEKEKESKIDPYEAPTQEIDTNSIQDGEDAQADVYEVEHSSNKKQKRSLVFGDEASDMEFGTDGLESDDH